MSTTTFVEAHSADPYVRELHRRAVRLLNDPTLDRQQRELHVRRLQAALREHQEKVAEKAARLAAKKNQRDEISRVQRNKGVADQSQVLARRREFSRGTNEEMDSLGKEAQPTPQPVESRRDKPFTGHKRPVLTLKRA